ncbi:hypothetical protein BEH94_07770 [Candidatus Altiarchaeales archaeon WOR_SM1_SCG]|nr:hypothetical protein BEH94_07770 [Candidatus Altiarchaeales archaeon WOR_SM1_SCG]
MLSGDSKKLIDSLEETNKWWNSKFELKFKDKEMETNMHKNNKLNFEEYTKHLGLIIECVEKNCDKDFILKNNISLIYNDIFIKKNNEGIQHIIDEDKRKNNLRFQEFSQLIDKFNAAGIKILPFKPPYSVLKLVNNFDVLCYDSNGLKKAEEVLIKEGYELFFSDKYEALKRMYIKYDEINNIMLKIHLHTDIGWDDLVFLDKREVFDNSIIITLNGRSILSPNKNDELLINCSHILFENFKITLHEYILLKKLVWFGDLNIEYLFNLSMKNGWGVPFIQFATILSKIEENLGDEPYIFKEMYNKIKKKNIALKYTIPNYKFPIKISRGTIQEGFKYKLKHSDISAKKKYYSYKFRRYGDIFGILKRRQKIVISLIGFDGSGKSRHAKLLRETLGEDFIVDNYYYGWEPSIIVKTVKKIIGFIKLKKSENKKVDKPKSNFLTLFLIYIEYLSRYFLYIFLNNRFKPNIVITDRYFYDILIQNGYCGRDILSKLFIKIFPRPTITFLLDADTNTIRNRKDELTIDEMLSLRNRYDCLSDSVGYIRIDTNKSLNIASTNMVKIIFKEIIKKYKV